VRRHHSVRRHQSARRSSHKASGRTRRAKSEGESYV